MGTPKQKKPLVLFKGGHVPPFDSELKKEMLDWPDTYPVPYDEIRRTWKVVAAQQLRVTEAIKIKAITLIKRPAPP